MNHRINELGRQAMSDVMNGSDPYGDADKMYIPAEFMEKFAELIVLECSRISELKEQGSAEYDPDTSVGHYMRLHFGVKE
jgi:hypothetical protein